MAKHDKSISERHGAEDGYRYLFGSADPAELTERAKRQGSTAAPAYGLLRNWLLDSLRLEERPDPEYMIITGCIRVFDSTLALRRYFRLLDKLGIAYTFLRMSEYCSNLPALHTAKGEEAWQAAWTGARDLMEMNLAQARELGVRNPVYFCSDGFAVAQEVFTRFGMDMEPLFYLDILSDRLEGRELRLEPCVVGYYQGCWRERRETNPKLKLNQPLWRAMLDRIEGIRVVELSTSICCKENPLAIVEEAESHGADCIVTPCNGVGQRNFRALKRIPAKTVADILFEALGDDSSD